MKDFLDFLRRYARVAEAIPPIDRYASLSYGVHALAAELPEVERRALIEEAFREGWGEPEVALRVAELTEGRG